MIETTTAAVRLEENSWRKLESKSEWQVASASMYLENRHKALAILSCNNNNNNNNNKDKRGKSSIMHNVLFPYVYQGIVHTLLQ